jgi:hypothetical protein
MNKLAVTLAVFILVLIMFPIVLAQTGAWISHTYSTFGTGSLIYKCGGNCLGFTYENASKIICFDITNSAWHEGEFASPQHFNDVLADGNIVFAYTDTYIVAYSGLTSEWGTERIIGTPLQPASMPSERNRSYQCGANLAIFVTTEKFYVYNISENHWRAFDYTLPADYSGIGYYWVNDDYAGVILYRTDQRYPTSLAYSAVTLSFAETDRGMAWVDQDMMDNGFAGAYYWDTTVTCYVVGYSAQTNQFTHIDIPSGYFISIGGFLTENHYDDFTISETTARKVIEPYVLVRYIVYCYDTRIGGWTTNIYDFDPQHDPGFFGWYYGGRFANAHLAINEDSTLTTGFYSGFSGQIYSAMSGIRYHGSNFQCEGGKAFCLADSEYAWGHNIETGQSATTAITGSSLRYRVGGEHYVAFNMYDTSDSSYTYFYHAPSNTWQSVILHNSTGTAYVAGKDVFVLGTSGANADVCFYSAPYNQITQFNFSPGSSISVEANNYIAYATLPGHTVLFDTRHNSTFQFDFGFPSIGINDNTAMFADNSTNTLYGYSAVTNSVSQLAVASTPYRRGVDDYIGLAYLGVNGSTYYAFNAIYGNWVELVPTGNYIGSAIGDRTALVVRNNILYAFDPQGLSSINDQQTTPVQPRDFELLQNYPNPFNSATSIEYCLLSASDVNIEIFDILGKLVDEYRLPNQKAGTHLLKWSPKDSSSGFYFYRLTVNEHSDTRKMLLIK